MVEALAVEERSQQVASVRNRAGPLYEAAVTAGADVSVELCDGNVEERLFAVIQATVPDLVVYGAHKAIHTDGAWRGRMPVTAMLRSERPTLVVSPQGCRESEWPPQVLSRRTSCDLGKSPAFVTEPALPGFYDEEVRQD